jgi:hypothetical protein
VTTPARCAKSPIAYVLMPLHSAQRVVVGATDEGLVRDPLSVCWRVMATAGDCLGSSVVLLSQAAMVTRDTARKCDHEFFV